MTGTGFRVKESICRPICATQDVVGKGLGSQKACAGEIVPRRDTTASVPGSHKVYADHLVQSRIMITPHGVCIRLCEATG